MPFDQKGPLSAVLEPGKALVETINEFRDVISLDEGCVGGTNLIEHDIVLEDETPVHVRPRPIPFHLRDVVLEQVSKMLSLGVIKKSVSPWSSPILLVPKPDGKYRFCVDFRQLNSKSRKDNAPVPRIDTIFSLIGGAKIFSTLDLLAGFWQVFLTERAREYTAFTVGNQHYEFVKMPFGLSGAPFTFIRLMNIVLDGLENVVVYGDDVLIYSKSFADHADHVRAVLDKLRQAGLVLNARKCQFGQTEVKFLGHKLSAGKFSPLPEKVSSVQEFPQPSSKKQLQSFLGLAGFYRRFIRNFSALASPLYDLLRKGVPWQWGTKEDSAFEEIKRCLCDHPVVLNIPDFNERFELSTDASGDGLGAVLSQKGRVVEYASRRLNPAEINYSTTDRELLVVVWAIERWRHYLFGRDFTVITDHRPITYLMTVKDPKGKMARWISRLQEYSFELRYRPGSDNSVADCLSRVPERLQATPNFPLDHEILPEAMNAVSALVFVGDPKVLAQEQRNDPQIAKVIVSILSGERLEQKDTLLSRYRQIWHQLKLSEEGVLLRRFKHKGIFVEVPVVPPSQRSEFLEMGHGSAHMGVERKYELIRVNAYWPGLQTDVQKFVTTCERCQLSKSSVNRNKAPLQSIFTARPMETWAMDIMGPLPCSASGYRYILVATDLFTKWVEAIPLVDQTASAVAHAFVEKCVFRFGAPRSLLTDQGSNFESLLMREVCLLLGIKKLRTSPFHPRTDG